MKKRIHLFIELFLLILLLFFLSSYEKKSKLVMALDEIVINLNDLNKIPYTTAIAFPIDDINEAIIFAANYEDIKNNLNLNRFGGRSDADDGNTYPIVSRIQKIDDGQKWKVIFSTSGFAPSYSCLISFDIFGKIHDSLGQKFLCGYNK